MFTGTRDFHGHYVGQWRLGVSPLRERTPSAEQQQPAAPLAHKIGQHPQLLEGEERGFDAAEKDGPVAEQLFSRLRKSGDELETVLNAQPQELVLGGSLQRD